MNKYLSKQVIRKFMDTSHQFEFREKRYTIERIHKVTEVIQTTKNLALRFYQILRFYSEYRFFRVKCEGEFSKLKSIRTVVSQGSVLWTHLCLIHIHPCHPKIWKRTNCNICGRYWYPGYLEFYIRTNWKTTVNN